MSDDTLRLLTSADALDGYLVGLAGLLILGFWAVLRRSPAPFGGVVIAATGVGGLHWVSRTPIALSVGLLLLVVAGLVPSRSLVATMALSIPGATAIAAAFIHSPHSELIVLVVTATALLGPLVAQFDRVHAPTGMGMPLMAISYAGVLVTVPDTDQVIMVAAAAGVFVLAGWPLRLAQLGASGALASTGLLVWAVAAGGGARRGALVAGVAALGLLAADPVARIWRGYSQQARIVTRVDTATFGTVGVQAALCILLALLASAGGDQPLLVGVVAVLLLTTAAVWSTALAVSAAD